MKKFLIASVLATTILIAQAKADTIVFYSFNDTSAGTASSTIANTGSLISSFGNFNAGASPLSILSSVTGNPNNHSFPAGNSISQNFWNGDASYFQFTLDSAAGNYYDIIVSWAENSSGTGPHNAKLQYSTTGVGGTYLDFATFATPNNSAMIQDLSAVSAIESNANVVFRLVGLGTTSNGGTMKIDNLAIEATALPVPEPSTVLLVGMSLAGLLAIRRRRS